MGVAGGRDKSQRHRRLQQRGQGGVAVNRQQNRDHHPKTWRFMGSYKLSS